MNTRTIFPNLRLFKKTVMEHFLVATREIFKRHPAYLYIENQPADTNIHIEPTYGNVIFEGKAPQLLVKVGSYDFSLQDTFNQNMFEEVKNELGVIVGYRSLKNMKAQISVIVRAYAEEESSDIADEICMLGAYATHHMFTQVGINIKAVSVSSTNKSDAQSDWFDTMVSFLVDVPWQLSQVSDKEVIDYEAEIEIPTSPITEEYRSPNVYVDTKDLYEYRDE